MARIRSIKPEFFLHEGLAELPPLHRLAFVGLWTLADRDGRLEDRPKRIKASLFPYEDVDMDGVLTTLDHHGFIRRYEAGGLACISIPAFEKHQKPHPKEGSFNLPEPQGREISRPGMDEPGNFTASREKVGTSRVEVVVGCLSLGMVDGGAAQADVPQAAPAVADSPPPLELTPPPPRRKREPSAQQRLAALLSEQRTQALGQDAVPDAYPAARLNKMLEPLLAAKLPDEAVLLAHADFLQADRPAGLDPPFPLWAFATDWPRHLSRATRERAEEKHAV